MGEERSSWVKTFFTGRKRLIIIVVLVIGLMFLLTNVEESPPNRPQDVEQQETIKSDVAGVQANPSSTPVFIDGSTPMTDTRQQATLVKVVDGDTITVSVNGKNETIRIIGIDTPEVVDSRKTVECFGKEASDFAKVTFENNKTVLLESDPTQGERDKYQRYLRYVWIDGGKTDFGKLMIDGGYASEYTYSLPYKYQQLYKQAEKAAREANKGLWLDDACGSINASGGNKDCSDFETHKEAQGYFVSKGGSSTNNVDKLDSDHDGIACESLP